MKFSQQHPDRQAYTEKKLKGAVIPRGDAIITYTPARTFGAYCMRKFPKDEKDFSKSNKVPAKSL